MTNTMGNRMNILERMIAEIRTEQKATLKAFGCEFGWK